MPTATLKALVCPLAVTVQVEKDVDDTVFHMGDTSASVTTIAGPAVAGGSTAKPSTYHWREPSLLSLQIKVCGVWSSGSKSALSVSKELPRLDCGAEIFNLSVPPGMVLPASFWYNPFPAATN